jgi:hypothetical protein
MRDQAAQREPNFDRVYLARTRPSSGGTQGVDRQLDYDQLAP